jgi:isopentenyldiphosphate isomerase
MNSLAPNYLLAAREIARRLCRGDRTTQAELDALRVEWEPRLDPPSSQRREHLAIVRTDGSATGLYGPRWLVHLLGLRHRAIEVGFKTESGLIVLQRRSPTKPDWPGAFDMAVAGHIPHSPGQPTISFDDAVWKEISEEIGLDERDASSVLVEGSLARVGEPYFCFEGDPRRNPPFVDAEIRQVYAATISGVGLARIHFADNEVAGILLVTEEAAWEILRDAPIASGLRYSLPRYLDWLERGSSRTP